MADGHDDSSSSERGSVERDRTILCEFFDATGGPSSWQHTDGWKSDRPMGEWHGVETDSERRVVNLFLPTNNVEGVIPKALGELNFLQILNLRDNALHGDIPPQLWGLESLEILDLSFNKLSDTSNGNVLSNSFEAPDLYAQGGPTDPDDEHEHWTSEPLQASRCLQYVSFRWRDQGWGNRKGKLFLSIVPSSSSTARSAEGVFHQDQENGHRQLMPDEAEHEWTRVVIGVYPEDPLRRLARAGDRYRLSYVVGGGGGHELLATGFTLHFGGNTTSDGPYSRVLWKLDLGNNGLEGTIPEEIADLQGLGVLRLDNNSLNGTVPVGLRHLKSLLDVDLANNELDELPMDLAVAWASLAVNGKLEVEFGRNPWTRPPASVMSQGLSRVESWWEDINLFGEDTSNKLKIVLTGLAEAGKTTVVRHLTGRDPPDKRTIGVELTEWKPRDELPLSASLWDFAGQADYYASHHIFLTKGALFILVVDLFDLVTHSEEGVHDPRGAIFPWLDILHERVPGAAVALVGTHTGKFLRGPLQEDYTALVGGSGQDDSALSDLWQSRDECRLIINDFLSSECTPALHPRELGSEWASQEEIMGFILREWPELSECQRQLAEAEELLKRHVKRFTLEKTREIKLSRESSKTELERRASMERNNNSGRAGETKEQRERGSFNRAPSTRERVAPAPFIIHENVFRVNMLPESVDELSKWVVDAAANSSNGSTFSFPAVRVIVPSAWVEAIAAVEALGERKRSPYVMWDEAVEEFDRCFEEKHDKRLPDADSVLKRAMEHREAEGAVILWLEDGSSSNGMIHLDPRWLIELVRRVMDHNIVDKSKQTTIRAELAAFCDGLPASRKRWSELCDAHNFFTKQGRLDRQYLRFLWLHRTLEDKDDYSGVELDERAFESMLSTMIKWLFIYPCHPLSTGDRQWFVVPARLQEYGNEKVLEDEIWSGQVVVVTTAKFRRTHALRGIIGRFLAFSADKIVSSGECWQHGAHIRWEGEHEVLVCETFEVEDDIAYPAIAICVKGSETEARRARRDVRENLKSLIDHDVHGYPGLEWPEFIDSEAINSNEFQRVLRPYLDIKFADLNEVLEKISCHSQRLFLAAFPSAQERSTYPRLVMLVPDEPAEGLEVTPEEQTPKRGVVLLRETWDRWIRLCRSGQRTFRLVFLCEHDLSEVPCGPEGKGYPIKDSAKLFKTLKPLLQASLWLLRVAVGVVANVDLPLHDMLGALVKATTAEVVGNVASVPIPDDGVFNADANHTKKQAKEFKLLHGPAFASLCKFMRKQENKGLARFNVCSSFCCRDTPGENWRDHMVQVENGIGGWAWVLEENKDKYRLKNGSN